MSGGALLRRLVAVELERLLEQRDRLLRVAGAERDLAEPGDRARPVTRQHRLVERLLVQRPGPVEVVEPQRDLGLEQPLALGEARRRCRSRASRR